MGKAYFIVDSLLYFIVFVLMFSVSLQVRVNTRLLYQQTKFNLLREESEGYAKLVYTALVDLVLHFTLALIAL